MNIQVGQKFNCYYSDGGFVGVKTVTEVSQLYISTSLVTKDGVYLGPTNDKLRSVYRYLENKLWVPI